eukprot:11247917-Prorocentrum_lima.AAC.1
MASRQGEQHALMNCERTEQLMLSEYHQNLRLCQEEGNHGVQYLQMEMAASQRMNKFQSEDVNAQRGMLNGHIGHMGQPVG